MARINTLQLINTATDVGLLWNRSYQVQQDPAVQKAWREACGDVAESVKSVLEAFLETQAAWRRTASFVDSTRTTG